jgi:CRP/FNR family transcriptional regulator, nitrogen oxide reductase regulator
MKTQLGMSLVMTTDEITARINKLRPRFLEGFTPRDLAVILGEARLRQFDARSLIASEGHYADKLFLILEGLARTFTMTRNGEKIVLLWVPPGEVSGGRSILSKPLDYLVSTETVTDSSVLVWNRAAILPLTKRYTRLLENGLMIASDYLDAYRDLHVAASYDSAGRRVGRVLNNLAKGMGHEGLEGTVVNISNEELANEANVTIFTVSRLLSDWQRKGFLVKSRGRILVRSPEGLFRSVR